MVTIGFRVQRGVRFAAAWQRHLIATSALACLAACGSGTEDDVNQLSAGTKDVAETIAIGDFNDDGREDIVIGYVRSSAGSDTVGKSVSQFYSAVTLQSQVQSGAFLPAQNILIDSVAVPWAMWAGDIDGVGGDDLAISMGVGAVRVYSHGVSPGNVLTSYSQTSYHGVSYQLPAGDLNSDGVIDLAVAGRIATTQSSPAIGQLRQDPLLRGQFSYAGAPIAMPDEVFDFSIADMNNDGRNDVVALVRVTPSASAVLVSLQSATVAGEFMAPISAPAGATTGWLAVSDIDGDGYRDVIVTAYIGSPVTGTLLLLRGFGSAVLLPATLDADAPSYPGHIVVGDFNNDSRADFALTGQVSGANVVTVLLQSATSGVFEPIVNYSLSCSPHGLVLSDINGDTAPDIALACGARGVIMLNTGGNSGVFAAPVNVGN